MTDRLGGLFDMVGVIKRNPGVVKSRETVNAARRGIYAWRRDNPDAVCVWCGRSDQRLDGHHVYPCSLFPEFADDPNEIVGLCGKRGCHLLLGHLGNYGGTFCPNIRNCRTEALIYVTVA